MKSTFIGKDDLQWGKAKHVLTASQKDKGSQCFYKPLKKKKKKLEKAAQKKEKRTANN